MYNHMLHASLLNSNLQSVHVITMHAKATTCFTASTLQSVLSNAFTNHACSALEIIYAPASLSPSLSSGFCPRPGMGKSYNIIHTCDKKNAS